jgi:hypothetical protein
MKFNLNYAPSITINFLIPLTKTLLAIFTCCYLFSKFMFFFLFDNVNSVIKINWRTMKNVLIQLL